MPLQLIPGHMVDLPEATTTEAGLMSAADKEKLDGLESGGGEGGWELTVGSEIYMRQDGEVTYSGAILDIGYGDVTPFGYGYDHRSGNWDGLVDDKFVAAFRLEAYGTISVAVDVSANANGEPGTVATAIFLNGSVVLDLMGMVAPSTGYHTWTHYPIDVKPGDVIAVKITNGYGPQTTKAKNVRILIADLTRAA